VQLFVHVPQLVFEVSEVSQPSARLALQLS
jgi:hypothetical protein